MCYWANSHVWREEMSTLPRLTCSNWASVNTCSCKTSGVYWWWGAGDGGLVMGGGGAYTSPALLKYTYVIQTPSSAHPLIIHFKPKQRYTMFLGLINTKYCELHYKTSQIIPIFKDSFFLVILLWRDILIACFIQASSMFDCHLVILTKDHTEM